MSKTICFDLRALQIGHEHRGIGAYVRSILEHLPKDDNKYLFYCFDKNDPIKKLGIKTKVNYELVQTPTINTVLDSPKNILGILQLVGHRFTPLKKYKPDTFVQFDFMLGIPYWRRTKTVVIGYDLIPLIMKNEYLPTVRFAWHHSAGKKAKLRAVLRSMYYRFRSWLHYKVYKKADKVVCISEASARSFHELLGINKQKLTAIPLAPVLPKSKPDNSVAKKVNKPYIFYVGGTDARKNVKDIVYAFNIAQGRGADIALVLAGNEFKEIEKLPDIKARNAILNSPYHEDIHLAGFVTDNEKAGLYINALAFIFTSAYEGFGLPVIEAMASSCPVIAYNNSSIPEAAGDAAVLVKTGDYVEVAKQIIALRDEKQRSEFIKKGLKQSKSFGWDSYVKALREAIE